MPHPHSPSPNLTSRFATTNGLTNRNLRNFRRNRMDKAKLAGQKGASVWIRMPCYYLFASRFVLNDGRQEPNWSAQPGKRDVSSSRAHSDVSERHQRTSSWSSLLPTRKTRITALSHGHNREDGVSNPFAGNCTFVIQASFKKTWITGKWLYRFNAIVEQTFSFGWTLRTWSELGDLFPSLDAMEIWNMHA